jgi:hypothetical protein
VIVQYDVTVPDMIDVTRRAARRREPSLGWRWRQSVLVSALLAALFSGVIEGSKSVRMFGTVGFFLFAFAAMTYLQKIRVATALARYVTEQYGSSVPFTFVIEITSAGMTTRQLGEETLREWRNVEKISETTGGIEFDIRHGGMVFVRDTGFQSSSERIEFLRLARNYAGR